MGRLRDRVGRLEEALGTTGSCACTPGSYRVVDTRSCGAIGPADVAETKGPPLDADGHCSACGGEVVVFRIVEEAERAEHVTRKRSAD